MADIRLQDTRVLADAEKPKALVPVGDPESDSWRHMPLPELDQGEAVTDAKAAADAAKAAADVADVKAETNKSFLSTFVARVSAVVEKVVPAWARAADPPDTPSGHVTPERLADRSVTEPKLADDAVSRRAMADDSVGGREIVAREVASGHLADRLLEDRHFPSDVVTTRMIGDNQVTGDELAGQSVGSAELKDALRILIDGKLSTSRLEDAMEAQFRDNFELDDLPGFRGLDPARADDGKFLTLGVTAGGDVSVGKADAPSGGGDVTQEELDAEEEAREAADNRLAGQIADLNKFVGGSQMRIDPPSVPDVDGLVRNYTLHIESLQGIPDTAVKVIVSAGPAPEGNFILAWDNNWIRTRREIPLTRLTQATLDSALGTGYITAEDHSLSVKVGFYSSSLADFSHQERDIALAFFTTSILIGEMAPGLEQVEDFARKDRPTAKVPSERTLDPLFDVGATRFNFGASTADPTVSGSHASVSDRDGFGTALSDTAVVTESNVISDSGFTLTNGEVTHEGAAVLVDCDLRDIAVDRFTGINLVLREPDGTVIAKHPLPSTAVSENRDLEFQLAGLTAGGLFDFALEATVRGREQVVTTTLRNLRYRRDSDPPAESYVRNWARQEVAKEAGAAEARDARIERGVDVAASTIVAPTTVINRAPSWEAVQSGKGQEQTDADAFVIPGSGYAQAVLGNFGVSPILHVDVWKQPGRMEIYSDTAGRILLDSDGTRVKVVNENAAGNGPWGGGFTGRGSVSQALLFGTRGLRWMTWPESASADSPVTFLTEAQIRALVPSRFETAVGASPAVLPEGTSEISVFFTHSGMYAEKRILLRSLAAANRAFYYRADRTGNDGVEIDLAYAPDTRTLTYAGHQEGSARTAVALTITAIGEA